MTDATRLLDALAAGDPQAAAQLLPLVYDELRRLAAAQMAAEKPGQTLQPTALVHEAFLRLVGDQHFDNRRHFFAAAAEAMRRILVENARRKRSGKHGGRHPRVELDGIDLPAPDEPDLFEVLAVDEVLDLLAREDPAKAELVKLRFFGGLSVEEAASCLGISRATADRHWAYARAWIYDRLQSSEKT